VRSEKLEVNSRSGLLVEQSLQDWGNKTYSNVFSSGKACLAATKNSRYLFQGKSVMCLLLTSNLRISNFAPGLNSLIG
jgi:hypothetical protein